MRDPLIDLRLIDQSGPVRLGLEHHRQVLSPRMAEHRERPVIGIARLRQLARREQPGQLEGPVRGATERPGAVQVRTRLASAPPPEPHPEHAASASARADPGRSVTRNTGTINASSTSPGISPTSAITMIEAISPAINSTLEISPRCHRPGGRGRRQFPYVRSTWASAATCASS